MEFFGFSSYVFLFLLCVAAKPFSNRRYLFPVRRPPKLDAEIFVPLWGPGHIT